MRRPSRTASRQLDEGDDMPAQAVTRDAPPKRAATPPLESGDPEADRRLFRRCLGQYGTGIAIITIKAEGQRAAITVNSFASVSLDPLLVLLSVAHPLRRPGRCGRHRQRHTLWAGSLHPRQGPRDGQARRLQAARGPGDDQRARMGRLGSVRRVQAVRKRSGMR